MARAFYFSTTQARTKSVICCRLCACVVRMCDVPLQDVLHTAGLKPGAEDISFAKASDLKDSKTTAARDGGSSHRVKKSPSKAARTDGSDATSRTERNSFGDKTRQREQFLQEFYSDHNKLTLTTSVGSPPISDSSNRQMENEPVREHKRRRFRQSVNSKNAIAAQVSPPVNEHEMTRPPGGDVCYGSEAVEDVIQRLLDNDELTDDAAQPRTMSSSAGGNRDRRRSREMAKKSVRSSPRSAEGRGVKSPRSLSSGHDPASIKSPGSVRSPAPAANCEQTSDAEDMAAESSGPRIKHVCRYASIALGKPLATFPPVTSSQLHLSALPSQDKERILVDKSAGVLIRLAISCMACDL